MIPLLLDGNQLMKKQVVKFLGAFIDEKFLWLITFVKRSQNPPT